MNRYELRLAGGRRVVWEGVDGEDAARRYVDSRRVAGERVIVVAWREADRHGLFVLGDVRRIVG